MENSELHHDSPLAINEMNRQIDFLKQENMSLSRELERLREQFIISERNNVLISSGIENYENELHASKTDLQTCRAELQQALERLAVTNLLYNSRLGRLARSYYKAYDSRYVGFALRKTRALARRLRGRK